MSDSLYSLLIDPYSSPLRTRHSVPQTAAIVTLISSDTASTADAGALVQLISTPSAQAPPVSLVINSGGVLADAVLHRQSAGALRQAAAPKAVSMQRLMTGTQPVAGAVLFSSSAALFGAPGQASYAAANASLEGWAAAAAGGGVPASAVQWGAWEVGMAADDVVRQRAQRTGLLLLTPAQGTQALAGLLAQQGPPLSLSVMRTDWSRLLQVCCRVEV